MTRRRYGIAGMVVAGLTIVGVAAGAVGAVAAQQEASPTEPRNATVRSGGELNGIALPGPGEADTAGGDLAAVSGKKITRKAVLKRARSWVSAKVPYCLGHRLKDCADKYYRNSYGRYRADCSGFVSMAWNLGQSLTTRTLPRVARRIDKSDLKAGDILNRPGRHVVLFAKWANSAKTAYWGYEQTPPRAVYRKIPYPYFNGGGGYEPYRYRNIVDGGGDDDGDNDKPKPGAGNVKSVDGDRYADVVAVKGTTMWLYPGKGNGGYGKPVRLGGGWRHNYNRIAVGDINADGYADILATATDGALFYWRNKGNNRLADRKRIGHGWKTKRWFALADIDGDGKADLLGLHGDKLLAYIGKGNGRFATPVVIGRGWKKYQRIIAGDVNRDGRSDLYGIDRSGGLWYAKNTRSSWAPGVHYPKPRKVGSGWTMHKQIYAADFNADRRLDVIGVRKDGTLWHYRGAGNGGFAKARKVGRGWSQYRLAAY